MNLDVEISSSTGFVERTVVMAIASNLIQAGFKVCAARIADEHGVYHELPLCEILDPEADSARELLEKVGLHQVIIRAKS